MLSNGAGSRGKPDPPATDVPVDVFLHIPKTAGDTLMVILWRQYRDTGGYLEVPDPHRVPGSSTAEDPSFENVKRLVRQSSSKQFRLIYGHMPFGIHEAVARPARYFTMVRRPVERALSHYYYVKREPEHVLHREVTESGMTLHDYVTSGIATELSNGQTALLAGEEQGAPSSDTALLRRARANIEANFAAAGLTEDFDRSIVLFKLLLGWEQPVAYEAANVTVGRPPASAISEKTIEEIKAQNQLDEALYRFIRERFQAQIEDAGAAVKRELWQLRLGNALYRHGPRRALRMGWAMTRRLLRPGSRLSSR